MEVQLRLPQCSQCRYYCPCPVGKAIDGFRRQFCNRRALLRVAAIICILYLLYLSTGNIPEWFGLGIVMLEGQPSDGGTGGNSGSGQSNGGGSDSGGGESQGAAQAPPPGGSGCSGGSSSGGDNGDDDPRQYHRPEDHKSISDFECEEEENDEEKSGDLTTGHEDLRYTPENMVTSKLQPVQVANAAGMREVTLSHSSEICALPSSSGHLAMFNFDRPQEPKFCPLFETEPSVDQPTPDYHQQEISATSLKEEYITVPADSFDETTTVPADSIETTHSMPMNSLPFWLVINHMSFAHPDDVQKHSSEVSQEYILANQVQTFTNLAQLVDIQLQVLQASGAMEPIEFTLAFMFGDEHSATLVPLPSDMPFDPTLDAVIVAVPADHVLANFTVRVNPLLRKLL